MSNKLLDVGYPEHGERVANAYWLPTAEYLKYIHDVMEDPEECDVPHVEVEITTDLRDLPIREMADFLNEDDDEDQSN